MQNLKIKDLKQKLILQMQDILIEEEISTEKISTIHDTLNWINNLNLDVEKSLIQIINDVKVVLIGQIGELEKQTENINLILKLKEVHELSKKIIAILGN